MICMKDVAKAAKVSTATVSRVLNNSGYVLEETRVQVLASIRELGYTPNSLGSSLRKSRTNNIIAVIPDVISAFNYTVLRAMESIAFEEGYNILLGDTQNLESRERSFATMVKSRQADGILLFCSRMPFTILPGVPLADQLPPLVNACEESILDGIPKVNINNVAAANDAVNYLLSLGHKKIAAITGNDMAPSSNARLEGYKKALGRASLPIHDDWIINGDYSQRKAENATRKIMSLPEKPTAIFCFSDDMAISCMSALMSMGYKIPTDISVLGFDNITYASYCYPTLTTVCQPMVEIGAACMELLLPQLRGKKMDGTQVILNHSLIVRESTGPVSAKSA